MAKFKPTADLTRIEALDRLGMACTAYLEGKWGTAAEILGITADLAESVTKEEFDEMYQVRLTDVMRRAGLDVERLMAETDD